MLWLDQPGLVPGTLPWLESNEALALATRMETRLPWRPTRGSLTSPSYLVRKRALGPPGEFHGLYSPWGCKESDTTEQFLLSL